MPHNDDDMTAGVVASAILRMRADILSEALSLIMDIEMDISAIAPEHVVGYRAGFLEYRRQVQERIEAEIRP